MKIFLDIDDCIADFTGPAVELHGCSRAEVEKRRAPGEWSVIPALSDWKQEQLTLADFWRPIHDYPGGEHQFWVDLPLKPWAVELVAKCHEYDIKMRLLSTPYLSPWSYSGKIAWVGIHFPSLVTRTLLWNTKEDFAHPDVILIDDRAENVDKFRIAGGKGILFPAAGNLLSGLADSPVPYVLQQLEKLCI